MKFLTKMRNSNKNMKYFTFYINLFVPSIPHTRTSTRIHSNFRQEFLNNEDNRPHPDKTRTQK